MRILVYQRIAESDGDYYFAPALILNASSAITRPNLFDRRFETRFTVIMYTKELVRHLQKELEAQLKISVRELRVIPVEEIRVLSSSEMSPDFEVDNLWKSYAKQPSTIDFRVLCMSLTLCEQVASNIRNNPNHFAANLEVQYTMESQKTSARRLRVTVENIHNSKMFTELNQRYKNEDYAYLSASDAKQIQLEVMNNVMAAEVSDAEFLTKENMPTLVSLIDKALDFQAVRAEEFKEHMWNSTFWSDENARPDRVARELQDQYDKMTSEDKAAWAKGQSDSKSKEECGNANVGIPGTGSVSVSHCQASSESSSSASSGSAESFQDRVNKNKVVVVGDKITPKSANLRRANLAELRQKTNIESTQIRLAKVHGVLKSNLNVPTKVDRREVFFVRPASASFGYSRTEAKLICQDYYDGTLATLKQMRLAWSHGANWCFAGHVMEHLAYPSHECFFDKRTDPNRSSFCASTFDMTKPGVSIVDPGQNTTYSKAGVNCFGVKPAMLYQPTVGPNVLITAWFNSTSYSRHN